MTIRRHVMKALVAAASTLAVGSAAAQELVVWHDLGENGIKWFQVLSSEFAKTRPGVTVRSISYPTEQWFGRAISALTIRAMRASIDLNPCRW